MNKHLRLWGAALCVAIGSSTASAAVIPVTAFTPGSSGGGGNFMAKAFDDQPATAPTHGDTVASPVESWSIFGNDRYGGMDFGESYADFVITDVFVLQGSWTSPTADSSFHWSADTSGPFDAGAGDVAAPDFGILDYSGTGGTATWLNVFHDGNGVTPAHRYLMLHYLGGGEGNFKYEIAFVGQPVPEPASAGLVALGGLAMLLRRRRA